MASYTFNTWHYYNRSGDTMTDNNVSGYGTDASTVTENSPNVNTTLTPDESNLSSSWGGGGVTYHGTFEHGGRTFLVFEDVNYGYFLGTAEENVPDADFPTTWDFGNVVAENTIICFAKGTLIATATGEVAVERLRIGNVLRTAMGHGVAVRWIGRQTVATRFRPAERLGLVRFAAGSLGEDLPHTDLTVTADHGMLVDGVICHAGGLVNGTTITNVPLAEMGESYTVYHIETETHEIILANGAPAETFIDNVSRRAFDNFAEFDALYGDVPEMEELPYPRAMSARQVPGRIRALLTQNAAA